MKNLWIGLSLLALSPSCNPSQPSSGLNYPDTRKDSTVDVYFGQSVPDPYRWLEDDLSEETADWVEAQNAVTQEFLGKIPYRKALRDRLEKLWNYEKISAPFKEGRFTYFFKNDGLQNHSVLYRKDESGNEEVFLDPNQFSADGTASLAGIEFSKDGGLVAYQISEGGSDWRKVVVMDAQTRERIEDTLRDVKFSGLSWKGNEGFYYSSYDKPEEGSALSAKTDQHKLYFHKVGQPQKEDALIFGGGAEKRRYVSGSVTEDGRFLQISAAISTTGNELYVQDLSVPNAPIVPVVNNFDNDHYVLTTVGDRLIVHTNLNAPNSKLVSVDAKNPAPTQWVDLVPEVDMPMEASTGSGFVFCRYLKDATSLVKQYDVEGRWLRDVTLPGLGTAGGFSAKAGETELYYSFTNAVYPNTIFQYDPKTGTSKEYIRPKVDFDPSSFESEQVFYTSKDGTRIPMILTYKKGMERNGKNPVLLYGYGGFNISLTPSFSVSNLVWMEQGGIYAVANIRGGGEYGESWHSAGTQLKKQNVFDDFIAAAEYLIAEKYTDPAHLAIHGGSNGGLLVGACMTQRPELFRVALPAVGVLDMLRYHTFTAGAGWAYDYGTAEDSETMVKELLRYSPVHALKEGTDYPATMVMTADHDDRVVPAHSFKFAARLQECHTGTDPVLIRIETKAGHGAGKPTSMVLDEQADKWAFTLYNMGFAEIPYPY
ncbi:prolyl oligopeptidase family serine peptidase [bacterium]|nr:prolyl oligopeptidase family serine peptidase [bacterium]